MTLDDPTKKFLEDRFHALSLETTEKFGSLGKDISNKFQDISDDIKTMADALHTLQLQAGVKLAEHGTLLGEHEKRLEKHDSRAWQVLLAIGAGLASLVSAAITAIFRH